MPRVRRITDAKTLNKAVNRPDVLPTLAPGYESLDMSGFFKRRGNIALKYGRAVVLLAPRKGGVYEMHYILPEDMRGCEGLAAVREVVNYAFTALRAKTIVGKVPKHHLRSRVFARALGAMPTGPCRDAEGTECIGYVLEAKQWADS